MLTSHFIIRHGTLDGMPPRRPIAPAEDQAFQRALGTLVRELRKPRANQDDFADAVGVYRSHMGLIEQGRLDIRLSTLRSLAAALGLPLHELLRQTEARLADGAPD